MDKGKEKILPVREVDRLPEVAILNEVILNKADGCFYLGVENGKGVKEHGGSVEKTSIRH